MEFLDFIKNNFFHVAPIIISGVIAASIMAERYNTLFKKYSIENEAGFLDQIRALVMKGRTTDAMALCQQQSGKPSAELVKEALTRANQPEELILNAIEIAHNRYGELIQKRTHFLATIANVATLLGLLGTIAGLIESFSAVGHADAQQKAALLANGISSAMNATMMGLGVAVPCMIIFSFFVNKANQLMSQLEASGLMVMDALMVASMNGADDRSSERSSSERKAS